MKLSIGLDVTAESFLARCMEHVVAQVGYQWGGRSIVGLDCSGFVTESLYTVTKGRIDVRATHNTDRLWTEVPRVPRWREESLWPGDLVLYYGASSTGPDDVSHVMVLLAETSLGLIYADTPFVRQGLLIGMPFGGSKDTDPAASKRSGRHARVERWNYRADIAGVCRLPFR